VVYVKIKEQTIAYRLSYDEPLSLRPVKYLRVIFRHLKRQMPVAVNDYRMEERVVAAGYIFQIRLNVIDIQ